MLRSLSGFLAVCILASPAYPSDKPTSALSQQHRIELIRTFNADLVYIRAKFPMGKTGLTLKDGELSPSGEKLDHLIAMWGPSVKPGDRAMITQFLIKGDR